MKFRHFIVLVSMVLQVTAVNYFTGIVASNSGNPSSSAYVCRTQEQWNTVATDAASAGFHSIHIEGFDCNALDMISSAAQSAGITVLAGLYISGTILDNLVSIDDAVQTFIAAYNKYGADRFVGLTVGNEVNDSPINIMNKVNQVQALLSSLKVTTPVSTVHTWTTVRDNPVLCDGNFVGANAHAFYDGGRTSGQTGEFIFQTVVPALQASCPGKEIIITESGWPSRGNPNNAAVPSIGDERLALTSLNCASKGAQGVSVYAFEYDDQLWKPNSNEQSFGIFGKIANTDIFTTC